MKSGWKKYLLYASVIIIGGSLLFILNQTIRAKNTGFGTKTLWDWMDLLIIPLILAGGAIFLNRSERNNERDIASDRQREAALQAYLDRMTDLLLHEKLLTSKNKGVRNVARIRTLTVLRGLDARRQRLVMEFLYEAKLISQPHLIVDLRGADLSGIDLSATNLRDASLSGVNLSGANISPGYLDGADLSAANLSDADLRGSSLEGTIFVAADLSRANLKWTNLTKAGLIQANLSHADLTAAWLSDAYLLDTELEGCNLSFTNLSNAKV